MKEMTCIVCPNGCQLQIGDDLVVTGNLCKRGQEFALNELKNPVRSISSTVKTIYEEYPVVSVKTNGEIPKDKIQAVMQEINKVVIKEKLGINEVVIKNVCDTGIDIVMTTNNLKEIN